MLPTTDAERKALPIFTFLVEYFPDVIVELTKLCVQGNIQHNPELKPTDIKWAREKSTDQMNTAFRHMMDRGRGIHFDSDGVRHIIKSVWRNMAQAQLDIEAFRDVVPKPCPVAAPGGDGLDCTCPPEVVGAITQVVEPGQTWQCYPDNWPHGMEADQIGDLTAPSAPTVCQCGFTICKLCQFP